MTKKEFIINYILTRLPEMNDGTNMTEYPAVAERIWDDIESRCPEPDKLKELIKRHPPMCQRENVLDELADEKAQADAQVVSNYERTKKRYELFKRCRAVLGLDLADMPATDDPDAFMLEKLADEVERLRNIMNAMEAKQKAKASATQLPTATEIALRRALQFYADRQHMTKEMTEWETVSGEPQNWLCVDTDQPFMVENGYIAREALKIGYDGVNMANTLLTGYTVGVDMAEAGSESQSAEVVYDRTKNTPQLDTEVYPEYQVCAALLVLRDQLLAPDSIPRYIARISANPSHSVYETITLMSGRKYHLTLKLERTEKKP